MHCDADEWTEDAQLEGCHLFVRGIEVEAKSFQGFHLEHLSHASNHLYAHDGQFPACIIRETILEEIRAARYLSITKQQMLPMMSS